MKIPKKLQIGAHTYWVQRGIVDKLGETNRIKQTITLDRELPVSQAGATLFHEIFHTVNNELDHTLLDSLAEQLYQVFHDNNLLR